MTAVRAHSGPHRQYGNAPCIVVIAPEDERGLLDPYPPRTHGGRRAAVFTEVEIACQGWPDIHALDAVADELPRYDRLVLTFPRLDTAIECRKELRAVFAGTK